MSIITVLKHYLLLSSAWDLGIFNQVFWSSINGRFFYYTVEPWAGNSFFAVHFSPILIFVLPFYAIFPFPEFLLILQSFVIALGVVPLYFLARTRLNERLAFLLSASYLINPLIWGANLFDFHFEAFVPVTLFSTLYFLEKRNFKLYTLSLFLSLMVHEYVAFFAITIMVYEIIVRIRAKEELKKIAMYVALTIPLSIAWLFSASFIHSYFRIPETQSMTILAPLINEASNPLQLLSNLGYDFPQKLLYLMMLLAPLLFTPLLSPYIALSVPWLLFAFLLNYNPYYSIGFQYSLLIIPFVYFSSIHGIDKLRSNALKSVSLGKILVLSSMVFILLGLTLVQPQVFNMRKANVGHDIIRLIPQNASVLATNNLFPQISGRFNAWVLPSGYSEPYPTYYTGISAVFKEYANKILNENDPDYVLLDLQTEGLRNIKLTATELLAKKSYGIYAYAEDILLLKRNYTGSPLIFTPLNQTFSYETLTLFDGSIIPEESSKSGKVLVHTTQDLENVTFWGGPNTIIPHGQYKVAFRLRLEEMAENVSVITLAITTDGATTGTRTFNSTTLYVDDFESGVWKEFSLEFQMELPGEIEFEGLQVSNMVDLYLDCIEIVQLSY